MITPDHLIWAVVGLLLVGLLFLIFGRPKTQTGWPPSNSTVAARVVENAPVTDPTQLLGQLHQSIEAQGRALAYSRSVSAMIETQARAVPTPWTTPPATPPVPDSPKA